MRACQEPGVGLPSRLLIPTMDACSQVKRNQSIRELLRSLSSRGGGIYTLFAVAVDEHGTPIGEEVSGQITLTRRALAGGPSTSVKKLELLPGDYFEQLQDGVFSPKGDQVMLSAFVETRPQLLLSQSVDDAMDIIDVGSEEVAQLGLDPSRITTSAERHHGLSWRYMTNYYPCNWVGGVLDPLTHTMIYGFQGGLDDVKLFEGLRDEMAIRSEVERGFEHLRASGLSGQGCGECVAGMVCDVNLGQCVMQSQLPSEMPCANSTDCPAYHVCETNGVGVGTCKVHGCQGNTDCVDFPGTHSVMTPSTVIQAQEQTSLTRVCHADCAGADSQCYTQACLNGPCRFCEQGSGACIEFREEDRDYGGYMVRALAGCPDSNSFYCEQGACLTECYAFEDGESVYLCDPLVEYCDRGFCRLLDWEWWDIAPSSFSGLGQAQYDELIPDQRWPGYTMAVVKTSR